MFKVSQETNEEDYTVIKWIKAIFTAALILIIFMVITVTVSMVGQSLFGHIASYPTGMAVVSALVLTGLIAVLIKDDV